MRPIQNLHTHSTYCDGIHTPAELVRMAITKGFSSLGFSGHSIIPYSPNCRVTPESTEAYRAEIRRLQAHYGDSFPIFLGLEVDLYCGADLSDYDYLIGSVHYLKLDGEYVGIDRKADVITELIRTRFGGDGLALARLYYETLAELPRYGSFDIIGHPDLIAKNIEAVPLFEEQSEEYLSCAREALEALRGRIPFFEVNTGAMARGYRTTPYPSLPLLKELHRFGFGAVISSDCHDGRKLDLGFELSRQLLEECGFRERYILTKSGFEAVAL